LFDMALLLMGGSIGGLFLLVKEYFDRNILHYAYSTERTYID